MPLLLRRSIWSLGLVLTLLLTGAAAVAQEEAAPKTETTPKTLWADFNHYVRIARPDLAQAAGSVLLEKADGNQLLEIVESGDYPDYERTLQLAARIEGVKETAAKIGSKIQEARVARSREATRISTDIEKLGEGERANANATVRLRAAGQYSAPALLSALVNEKQKQLHPYVLTAMAQIGRPLVYPLCVALPSLEPVQQGQVAQVLAEIGYPRALPALKAVSENPKTDPNARKMVDAAYRRLAQSTDLPANVSAAELFLTLSQNHYRSATLGDKEPNADLSQNKGVVWVYSKTAGLVAIQVPLAIYGDVMAMRSAEMALTLNPQMDQALSLWLASNLRRANRLPQGETDPSYPAGHQPPAFYLEMAGPLRQHDVLARALDDKDSALALNAIAGLTATAGTDALINREGTVQPLLRALSYPDRRVRFAATFAMTNARPKAAFPGSARVVPVLAEALRQGADRFAVVLGKDRESLNKMVALAKDLGYKSYGGLKLADVAEQVSAGPGVDLILTDLGVDDVRTLDRQTTTDYKLAAVPILAVVNGADQIALNHLYPETDSRVRSTVLSDDAAALKQAVADATAVYAGETISPEEAERYALTSLKLLTQVSQDGAGVFDVKEALPALIEALADKRPAIASGAAEVLATVNSADGQIAVGDAALDAARPQELRIALLQSLAKSATLMGNHLNEVQLGKLLETIKTSQGELALAAAKAHGALTLPTANVVQLIEQP
ncbi:MAG: hypothetical protein K8S99_08130 [Planctomycetes bacterium]|nr:hypothetical protein [Planctomycetota bacterium]